MNYEGKDSGDEAQVQEPDLSGTYTARDYLNWKFEGFVELIRGKIFKMSPGPGSKHQIYSRRLLRKFYDLFPEEGDCQVFEAPLDVYLVKSGEKLEATTNVVQPDIFMVCDLKKLHEKGVVGSPDLVVEILSPGNSRKDLKHKLELYEEYAVPEYWIVDPENKSVVLYLLKNGVYQPQKPRVPGDMVESTHLSGLNIDVTEIFRKLPGEED